VIRILAKHPSLHIEYLIVGVYVPFSGGIAEQYMMARTITLIKAEFESKGTMVVVLGDWNAHTHYRQEQHAHTPILRRTGDARHPVNARGEALLSFINHNELVMTNGRIDGSHAQPDDVYTRRRQTRSGEQRTLIDYILVNHTMYHHCIRHENIWSHNGKGKIKTDHCLSILTTQNTLRQTDSTAPDHQSRREMVRASTRDVYSINMSYSRMKQLE